MTLFKAMSRRWAPACAGFLIAVGTIEAAPSIALISHQQLVHGLKEKQRAENVLSPNEPFIAALKKTAAWQWARVPDLGGDRQFSGTCDAGSAVYCQRAMRVAQASAADQLVVYSSRYRTEQLADGWWFSHGEVTLQFFESNGLPSGKVRDFSFDAEAGERAAALSLVDERLAKAVQAYIEETSRYGKEAATNKVAIYLIDVPARVLDEVLAQCRVLGLRVDSTLSAGSTQGRERAGALLVVEKQSYLESQHVREKLRKSIEYRLANDAGAAALPAEVRKDMVALQRREVRSGREWIEWQP